MRRGCLANGRTGHRTRGHGPDGRVSAWHSHGETRVGGRLLCLLGDSFRLAALGEFAASKSAALADRLGSVAGVAGDGEREFVFRLYRPRWNPRGESLGS